MKNDSAMRRTLTPAERGQIVQRVIVDGWTTARAAAAFRVRKRFVDAWVADYRRHGMASLRHQPRKSVVAEIVLLRFLRPGLVVFRRISSGLRRLFVREPRAEPLPLHRSNDESRGGGS